MIRITKGESLLVTGVLKHNNRLEDISTWDVKAAIRQTSEGSVLAEPDVDITANGTFTVDITSVISSALPEGNLVVAIRIAQPSGFIRTFSEQLMVKKDNNW